MAALFEILVFVFLLPYILFGVLLAKVAETIGAMFQPVILLAAVWVAVMGAYLVPSMRATDAPWVTMIESVAQSHVLGVPTPFAFFAFAGVLVVVSLVVKQVKLGSDGANS
ncbi:hypothetical protein HF209_30610 [Pseudomonas sp. WS 5096]|uniref:Uncharacterized protein n=1 Tax=Pseudomonas cremoris TaxID=2724178 RepID=A0ABR6TI14_9PSED|nr:hypothetical protein [Pseudomonas cremoris]MBC2385310.1 hypothetical protein [Pseudomonas cremoris]